MKKKQFQQEKQKNWLRQKYHYITSECCDIILREPTDTINKDKAKLNLEVKNVATFHNFVATQNKRD